MKGILLIGSFPPPLNGMTIANQVVFDYFKKREDVRICVFELEGAAKIKPKKTQGAFNFSFFVKALMENIRMIKAVIFNAGRHVYFVPGQSVLGFLRFAPAILIAFVFAHSVSVHIHGSKFPDYINQSSVFLKFLCRFVLKRVDKVVALTPNLASSFNKSLDISNATYCYNGTQIPIQYDDSIKYYDNTLDCLFLSNIMKDKGVLDLLDAFVTAKKLGVPVFLNLAGEIESGLESSVYAYFNAYPDIFKYHGSLSGRAKDSLLYRSSIFVLPSYDEGLPISLLEAYANGCAVVTTSVGGIPEVFQDSENGFYCTPGNPASIVEAIKGLESNRKVLQEIGRYNRAMAEKTFSAEAFGSRLLEIFFLEVKNGFCE